MAFDSTTSITTRMPTIRGNVDDWNAAITTAFPTIISRWYDVVTPMPIIKGAMNDWVVFHTTQMPTFNISVLVESAYIVNITTKMPTILAVVETNPRFSLAYTTPKPTITFTVDNSNTYSLNAITAMPIIKGTIGTEGLFSFSKRVNMPIFNCTAVFVSTATTIIPESAVKDTWSMNTITTAHSRYTNYNFNSYFKIGNKNYGIGTNGNIYQFGADYDNGVMINAQIDLPISSFGEQTLKAVSDAFVFSRRDGDIELNLVVDEQQQREGIYINFDDKSGIHRKRAKIPKGMKGTVWQFKIKNVDGSDFSINSFEIFVRSLQRII